MLNARKLGLAIGIGWLALPFVACAGAFVFLRSESEFSAANMLFAGALTLPIILGTLAYLIIAINRYVINPRRTVVAGMLLLFPTCMTFLVATYFNAVPRRITPESVETSPFDRYFEYAPQIAFGCPCPFLRFYDAEKPDRFLEIHQTMFDLTSLLGDVTLWMFPLYVFVSLAFTLLPKVAAESKTIAGTG